MEPAFDIWTIFFLIAGTHGLFLSAMILIRKSKINTLLSLLILAFSLCMLSYVAYWTHYVLDYPWLGIFSGLTYSFGPLLYFYILSSKKKVVFHLWHFMPQGLILLSFFLQTSNTPSWIYVTQATIQCAHLLIYTILILYFIYTNKGYSNGALKLFVWRKKVALAFMGYSLSFIFYYILVWTGTLRIEYDYMISIALAFFIYFIGYHGFQHQEVFRMYEVSRYDNSSLTQSASASILKLIKNHMDVEKPYLDSSLRLQDLAEKLNLSNHYISQVINNLCGKNFADFVNEYRIKEAKKLLLEGDQKKIIHVAYDTGFNNKASFNNAFKRFTGMAPSEFRENESISSQSIIR